MRTFADYSVVSLLGVASLTVTRSGRPPRLDACWAVQRPQADAGQTYAPGAVRPPRIAPRMGLMYYAHAMTATSWRVAVLASGHTLDKWPRRVAARALGE